MEGDRHVHIRIDLVDFDGWWNPTICYLISLSLGFADTLNISLCQSEVKVANWLKVVTLEG